MKTLSIVSTILLCIVLYSCQNSHPNPQQIQLERDSVAVWIKHSYTTNLSNDLKIQSLNKAYQKLKSIPEDSIRPSQLSTIAYRFYQLNDSINFFKINKETMNLALKKKDSFIIADAHWSYALYHFNIESYKKSFYHYNIALSYFSRLQKEYQTARILYSMAFIKGRYRDYTGSEVLLFKAIGSTIIFMGKDSNLRERIV
ncbi:MAG: hypothetical protein MK076_09170, partial [Flavobacteriales bacterium]|nr:hypothetical protein [Flavobacteriales bacterium]